MKGWIFILEVAAPPWLLVPSWFSGSFGGHKTYRLAWIGVSVSVYRAEGLHTFFDQVERTAWRGSRPAAQEGK